MVAGMMMVCMPKVPTSTIQTIRRILLRWYGVHRRDLPWRHTRDPYHILVSEIMLQQTQVSRVQEKYHEFLREFPTLQALAIATSGDVIRVWAGLGYNRRALFLQRTAQAVMQEYDGVFPQSIDLLKKLPGVGDYTARAILSFAFEQPVPMMDTNHRRFYQRVFFGLNTKKDDQLLKQAEVVLPPKASYDWNQALMDFGSMMCLSGVPRCGECPLKRYCKAYPGVLKNNKTTRQQNKKTITFRETDRYVRGRIIDQLRNVDGLSINNVLQEFSQYGEERVKRIVADLIDDGLIVEKKKRLQLP